MRLTRQQVGDAAAIAEAWLRGRAYQLQVPAVSYGISFEGETVLAGARGLADIERVVPAAPETNYRVASITKTFTATVIMQLAEGGKVRLDEPVTEYLPWSRPALAGSGMTVRHLLTHSAGVIRDGTCGWRPDEFPTSEDLHAQVLEGGTFAEPAMGFRYSNVAYALLGEIIEAAGGRPFAAAVDRGVVRPVGMRTSGVQLRPAVRRELATGYWRRLPGEEPRAVPHSEACSFEPAGGMISNVLDLLRYQEAHFAGDDRLLSDLSKREMQRVQWQRSLEPHHGLGWMIWNVDGLQVRGHSGGYPGFVTRVGFVPEHRVAAAVLTNTLGPLAGVGLDVVYHVIGRVNALWEDAAASSDSHVLTRRQLQRYTGLYRSEWGEMLVVAVNRSLYLAGPDEDRPLALPPRLACVDGSARFLIADNDDYGNRGEEVVFDLPTSPKEPATSMRKGWSAMQRVD